MPTSAALPAVVMITGLPAAIAPSATNSMVLPAGGRLVRFAPLIAGKVPESLVASRVLLLVKTE